MAVTEMKKLTLLALKSDTDALMSELMWTGSVEISPPEESMLPTAAGFTADYDRALRRKSKADEALRLLKPYAKSGGGMFAKPDRYPVSVYQNAEAELAARLPMADEVTEAVSALQSAQTELGAIRDKVSTLRPWLGYDLPLAETGSRRSRILMGSLPLSVAPEQAESALTAVSDRYHTEWVHADRSARYLWMLCEVDDAEQMQSALLPLGFLPLNFSDYGMVSATDAVKDLQNLHSQASAKLETAQKRLADLGERAKELRLAADLADLLLEREEAKQKLLCTKSAVLLTGWIPAAATPVVEEKLQARCESGKGVCAWEFSDPEEGDDIPILLQNGKISENFEPVVAMYSLPAYKTFDPTQIMSIFYFIIFGLMFGDAVYGLVLILAGWLLPKYLNLSVGTKKMIRMFGICGISSMISGILFGSYCGNMLVTIFGWQVRPILFDIVGIDALPGMIPALNNVVESLNSSMTFLVMALIIGVVHLVVAMGVRFYILCKEGKPFDAIVEIGSWYLIFAGIAIALLVHTIAGVVVAGIGVVLIVFFHAKDTKNPILRFLKGLLGLYDIVNFMSDLLSYSRIMALGLSSAIIAMVVNMLASMVGSSTIGLIFMPLVLIFGHVINIALNLLGTFVHTSRLQYIEFFGKFYVDGGRQFKPLAVHPAYTGIAMDEINQ
ncbi:MAG: V-type ATP synthase subunit I [Clostridia bacterium]|nr:V-type ATP synthase subunit I [Clostridia bacterium]